MVITFLVRPDHFEQGDVFSCMNDPIGLALKERLNLKLGDLIAVGADEVFLIRDNKCYLSSYDLESFYQPQPGNKPRVITLKFKEI